MTDPRTGGFRGLAARLMRAMQADPQADTPDAPALQAEREQLSLRAAELAELQRQLSVDGLSGLPLRTRFIEGLQRQLAVAPATGCALLLLRVPRLEALNLRLGREATDRLLQAIGHLLLTYVDRVAGASAGRLNGSDFALFLPVGGVASETAESLRDALAALGVLRSAAVETAVGGVDDLPRMPPGAALAEADAALARAEAGEGGGVVVDAHADLLPAAQGASAWRVQLADALAQGRISLHSLPVQDRQGHLVHLRCAARLQLQPDAHWLTPSLGHALARRSGLLAQLEMATLQLALQASGGDGQPRALRMGPASWGDLARVDAVAAALRSSPAQAARLSLQLVGSEPGAPAPALLAAAVRWRLAGVRTGMAAHELGAASYAGLAGQGLGYAVLDAQQLRGVAEDEAARLCAVSLLGLLRSLGLAVLVEDALDADDLQQAWSLGLDGALAAHPEGEAP